MFGLKKHLLLIAVFLIALLSVNNLSAQNCSFTLISKDSGCIPVPILAYANDTAEIVPVTSRQWILRTCANAPVLNINNNQLNPNFSYIPTVSGCFSLTMVSTNANGQTCTYTKTNILIADTPQILITQVSPTSFCAPRTVTVSLNNSTSCGNIDTTQIQWGCGNLSVIAGNPASATHVYNASCNSQCFDVVVTTKSTCGCYSTKRLASAVCVLPQPRANFTADVSSGVCVNSLTSHITADSSGAGFTYCWYIDGVQQQCGPSRLFTHNFPASSNCYNVKLVVSNTSGCSDSLTRDNFICVFAAPHLSFTQDSSAACVDSGQAGLLCLRNTSLPFLPIPIWRVRGGNPLVNLGPFTGDSVCVPLVNPGSYQVTLIGSYGGGCTDSLVVPNAFTLKPNPVPCFYADDTATCQSSLTTHFHNCSTAPPGSTYQWNFGAGVNPPSSNLANPTTAIQYSGLGTRDVSLAITSPNGCFKLLKKNNYVVVDTINPQILIGGHPYGCAPLNVVPQSITNTPYNVTYEWWVYDSASANLEYHHPSGSAFFRSYTNPGCYDVKLVITSTSGCVSSTWMYNAFCVGEPDTCQLTATPTTMCFEQDSVAFLVTGPCRFNRLIVHYGDETNPNAVSYVDNVTSFTHMYQSFGDFDPVIIPVLDSCEGEPMTVHITIKPPAASFTTFTSCTSGDTVCFTNQTVGANRFHWSFGCVADTFNTLAPCVVLPHCDSCLVSLTAYNDTAHCVHTKESVVQTVCTGITATFTPDTLLGCKAVGFASTQFANTTPGANAGTTVWHWGTPYAPLTSVGRVVTIGFYPGYYEPYMVYTAPGGCTDTAYGVIIGCNIDVDFGPTRLCLPDSFHFHTTITDPSYQSSRSACDSIVKWKWIFGPGGDTSNLADPVHYFSAGSHSVKVIVTNKWGCTDSITKTVTAGTAVYSLWNVDTNICPGSTVTVTNSTSSGVNLTESWELPGSNLQSYSGHVPPSLTYYTTGDYPFIYNVAGGTCVKSDTVTMHVHSPELSGYLSRNYASCPNQPVGVCGINTSQWVDSTTDIYTWDFGNREYLEVNPCDIYPQAGIYPVILTVETNNGCRDTLIVDTVVIDGPYGTISHVQQGACSCKDTVDFIVSTIKATQLTFVYGCNQGFQITNPISPVGTDLAPHVFDFHVPYCLADSCLPQLTLGDQTGCLVLINDSFVYIDSPAVGITFNNYGVCLSGTVSFFDATTFTLPGNISYNQSWYWDFGDPNDPTPSTLQNPSHYYSQPGVFPVTFSVVSNFGCHDTLVSNSVVVVPKIPITGFYADDSIICAETSVCFHDTSYVDTVTGPQFWYWDFGDGSTDDTTGPNVCHTYLNGGYYTVHLCLYDSIGCADCDSSFVLRVIPKPIAVAAPDVALCYGVQTQLQGSGAASCQWAPAGLVTNPNICDPFTTIYADTVFVLTVTDTFGCTGVDTLSATVARVNAGFELGMSACQGDSICVRDTSTNINGSLVSWHYDFGNGDSLSGAAVCYNYNAAGNYNVTETVTDDNGCKDTATGSINIYPIPVAQFSLNDTVICSDQSLCFTDLSSSITTVQSWEWSFGFSQGAFSGANPPCLVFPAPYQATYTVQLAVTDQNQCHDTTSIIVAVNEIPLASFNSPASCEDEAMILTSTSRGIDGALDSCIWLFWVGAATPVTSTDCNTSFMFPPGVHDVLLVVHDVNGCVDSIIQTVQTDSLSQLQLYPGDTTICLGSWVDYSVTGVFDRISWSPNVWISDANSATVTINPLGNIGYIVSAANGVCDAVNDTFAVQVISPVPVEVMATPDKIVLGLSSNITSQIGGPIDSIVWTPDETLDCRTCPNPVATPIQTTTYCATIYYGKNGVTCSNPACLTITVLNNCDQSIIYVPNTFTPNGDGLNDIFMIRGLAATRIKNFRIFDRCGKLVFEVTNGVANEPAYGWDGTDQTGEKLNPAVFVYTYEIECINHDIITGNGNITLIR